MLGCSFLASLQGQQNSSDTPAPHSALSFLFFFFLTFLIFDMGVNISEKQLLANCVGGKGLEPISINFGVDPVSVKLPGASLAWTPFLSTHTCW